MHIFMFQKRQALLKITHFLAICGKHLIFQIIAVDLLKTVVRY